ncbi:MAG TPA: hypothetical protein PK022_06720 [Syntrophales bacterium]|nr:hypothetical protein [Syntrophales bacterium]
MEQIRPTEQAVADYTFYYSELRSQGWGWVADFFRAEKLRKELDELTAERNRVGTLPLPRSEQLENLRAPYKAYQERRLQLFREWFLEWSGYGDRFKYVSDNTLRLKNRVYNVPPTITWPEIEQIFKTLPELPGAISAKAKGKALEKTEARIRDVETELSKVFPAQYRGRNGEDMRPRLVEAWREVQSKCNAPCGPLGWALEYSPPPEREAWEALGMADFVDKKGMSPCDPKKAEN